MSVWTLLAILLAATLLVALIADRLVAARASDRGTYWTRVLLFALTPTLIALLASWSLASLHAPSWQAHWHLITDLVPPDGEDRRIIALALPALIWALALLAAMAGRVDDPEPGRWLAGAIGDSSRRWWVLLFPGLAVAALIVVAARRLPQGDYPAALLGLLVCLLVTLIFIAFSRGRPGAEPAPAPTARHLPSWPETLKAQGIEVETLTRIPGEARAGHRQVAQAPELRPDLRPELARRALPWALLEAIRERAGNRLIAAPDDWGQVESVALLAEQLIAEGNLVTLVVVPDDAAPIRRELCRWLPDEASVADLGLDTRSDTPAFVWLAEAALLSDRLIPDLSERPEMLARIGAVAWWDLHRYSGVLAANFWAISHRFQRLLERRGRGGVRHLAFVRGAPGAQTQLTRFRELCLPQGFGSRLQLTIDDHCERTLELHLLHGHGGARSAPRARADLDTALAATRVSVAAGWPTHLAAPAHLDEQELASAEREHAGDDSLGAQLLDDPIAAGARILEVDAATVLFLPSMIAQTGRVGPSQPCLHVGLVAAFGNPYVTHLLRRLAEDPRVLHRWQRRMIAAVPQPGVVRRHLLLALKELPATPSGLREAFRWEPSAIDRTLAQLSGQHRISRRDVRYLARDQQLDRLQVEVEYNTSGGPERARPLTTLGAELVDIVDPGVGTVARIDPERLTIDAYPLRVLVRKGRRYRVSQWAKVDDIIGPNKPMRVDCRREDSPAKTWRVVSPILENTRVESGRRDIQIPGLRLTRTLIHTSYSERLIGMLEYEQDPATGAWGERSQMQLPAPIRSPAIATRGMLIELANGLGAAFADGLFSLAQALRHVFPVHLGVDEDAVAILAFDDEPIDDRTAQGLVILDLYPGGIGLVQSIEEEPKIIEDLLRLTHDWLAACCDEDTGCEHCLRSPLARSVARGPIPPRPSRSQTLALLRRVLPGDRSGRPPGPMPCPIQGR